MVTETTMYRYVIVDVATSIVINVCLWDEITPWTPEEGTIAVKTDVGQIGDTYENNVFIPAPAPEPVPTPDIATQIAEMQAKLAELTAQLGMQA